MSQGREQLIRETITAELVRQEGRIDPAALAAAIEAALDRSLQPDTAGVPGSTSPEGVYVRADEGRTPEQLNASNDDGRG